MIPEGLESSLQKGDIVFFFWQHHLAFGVLVSGPAIELFALYSGGTGPLDHQGSPRDLCSDEEISKLSNRKNRLQIRTADSQKKKHK